MRRPRLILADDHAIVMEAIGNLLERDYEVVARVGDGLELVEAAERLRPDLIVADMEMPALNGLDALKRLRDRHNDVKIVFLTMYGEPALAADALRAGASGYLMKHSAMEELTAAIEDALQGRVYLTSRIAKGVIGALTRPSGPSEPRLTPRQRDVLRLLAEGRRMKEIASILNLSTRTVETYKYEAMQTLGLTSTAELVRYALKHSLS